MSEFEDVLMRNRNAILEAQTTILMDHYPDRMRTELQEYAAYVCDTLIALMLTKTATRDAEFSALVKRVMGNNLDVPEMMRRVERFVEVVRGVVRDDPQLTPEKQVHIERMIDQSGRFLLMVVVPSVRGLKEDA